MTAHRHKNSAGKYVTVSDGNHGHSTYRDDIAALNAKVTALEARVTALEAEPQPEPEPEPSPIVISNIVVSDVGTDRATISWDSAPPATGQVEYGTTTAYGQVSTLEPSLLPHHIQRLSGLLPKTLYHFRIKATIPATP